MKTEIKGEIEIGERGDIEVFHNMRVKCSFSSERDKIRFPLTECIANLCYRGKGISLRIKTEIDRNRIEDIAEYPWQCEEQDASDRFLDSLQLEVAGDILPDRRGSVTDMVALVKTVESGTVDLQQTEGAVDLSELVEVDQQVEDPIEKFMMLRSEAPMKDRALVEAGIHRNKTCNRKLMNS